MTAAAMIRDFADAGIRLSRNGDRLHVEAKPGTITDDLRRVLTDHKDDLLAALNDDPVTDLRATLLALATSEGIDAALVANLPDADVTACAGLPKQTLLAYVRALADTAERIAGRVPRDESAVALCHGCGPVWVHPAVAAAAPKVQGMPHVLGCPWCLVRRAGRVVPRPKIAKTA